jgi:hypothetical protein
MDWILALVLVIGGYYIIELILKHRERMAQLTKKDNQ